MDICHQCEILRGELLRARRAEAELAAKAMALCAHMNCARTGYEKRIKFLENDRDRVYRDLQNAKYEKAAREEMLDCMLECTEEADCTCYAHLKDKIAKLEMDLEHMEEERNAERREVEVLAEAIAAKNYDYGELQLANADLRERLEVEKSQYDAMALAKQQQIFCRDDSIRELEKQAEHQCRLLEEQREAIAGFRKEIDRWTEHYRALSEECAYAKRERDALQAVADLPLDVQALHAYEGELEKVREILQYALPMGEVKHIGLLECEAGAQVLADENVSLRSELNSTRVLRVGAEIRARKAEGDVEYLQGVLKANGLLEEDAA